VLRNLGRMVIMATFMSAVLQVYNLLFHPELEKQLPDHVRRRPHLIFGKDQYGDILYFSRLGALPDILEWFGLSQPIQDTYDLLNGNMTIKEKMEEMLSDPINKLVNSIIPIEKAFLELMLQRATFPDVFNQRAIRDRFEYIADQFGLLDEYKEVAGKPTRGYGPALIKKLIYKVNPEENAYYEILGLKNKYMKSIGKEPGYGFWTDRKSSALYYYRMALKYDDPDAAKKYLYEYAAADGTKKGIEQSLRMMSPIYGIPKDKLIDFVTQLSTEDKVRMQMAIRFYVEVLLRNEETLSGEIEKAAGGA
jgi:hypothetical protein